LIELPSCAFANSQFAKSDGVALSRRTDEAVKFMKAAGEAMRLLYVARSGSMPSGWAP